MGEPACFESALRDLFKKAKDRASPEEFDDCLADRYDAPGMQGVLRNSGIARPPRHFCSVDTARALNTIRNTIVLSEFVTAQEKTPQFARLHMMLFAYLQVVETALVYRVVGNLLRVIFGMKPRPRPRVDRASGYQRYRVLKRFYESKKDDLCTVALFQHWGQLMRQDLRNAVAHNDFWIDTDNRAVVLISGGVSRMFGTGDPQERILYSFDEVAALYEQAKNFAEAFRKVFTEYSGSDLGPNY